MNIEIFEAISIKQKLDNIIDIIIIKESTKSDLIIIIPKCNGDIYEDDNDQDTIDETNNEWIYRYLRLFQSNKSLIIL